MLTQKLLGGVDMLLQILVFQWIVRMVSTKQIPSYVTLCSKSNPKFEQCIVDTINQLGPYLVKGIPEMDIPSVEPLDLPPISLHTNASLVKIDLELEGVKFFNCSNFKLNHLTANLNDITFNGTFVFPYVKATGNYKIKGTILSFTIESQGKLDFEAKTLSVDMGWFGENVLINGQVHFKFNKIKTNVDIKDLKLYFHNLFGNNQELTDSVNGIINENIQELKKDLDDVLDIAISEVFLVYFNRVYSLFPKDVLFPDE